MRKAFLGLAFGFILFGCSEKSEQSNKPVVENSEVKTKKLEVQENLNAELSSLENFKINSSFKPLNNIIKELRYKAGKENIKKDYCWGDCCGASKTLENSESKLYIFKMDCGDYGFGNEQYYFQKGELSIVRVFDYHIEEFPQDSNSIAKFKVEEKIFDFRESNAILKERNVITTYNNIEPIQSIEFKDTSLDKTKYLKEMTERFKEIKELENSIE